jgi:hypothetical protein
MVPLIIFAFFKAAKCWETVDCDKGKNSTMSPQIHVGELIRNFTISKRAGCQLLLGFRTFQWFLLKNLIFLLFPYRNITI